MKTTYKRKNENFYNGRINESTKNKKTTKISRFLNAKAYGNRLIEKLYTQRIRLRWIYIIGFRFAGMRLCEWILIIMRNSVYFSKAEKKIRTSSYAAVWGIRTIINAAMLFLHRVKKWSTSCAFRWMPNYETLFIKRFQSIEEPSIYITWMVLHTHTHTTTQYIHMNYTFSYSVRREIFACKQKMLTW